MPMRLQISHDWNLSANEAIRLQESISKNVVIMPLPQKIKTVGGVDVGYKGDKARAAIALLTYPAMHLISHAISEIPCDFPYIPGLLSFREAPAVLAALEKLTKLPDVLLVDGQGIAHPRRLGIASHLGVLLDMPTIGCAKSPLIGHYGTLGNNAGDTTPLTYNNEILGMAVRTKTGCKPLIVSIGHRCDLVSAVQLVLNCCRGYRLPEPTRLAHLMSSEKFLQKSLFDT